MLETIYNDFTTKMLPKIQEGLVITKDYFADLFGRYVKYLFITDLIYTLICLIGAFVLQYFVRKWIKNCYYKDEDFGSILGAVFGSIGLILFTVFFFVNLFDLIKDKYIPEVRVFEEIKSFNVGK